MDGGFIELYRVERDVVAGAVDNVKPYSIGVHGAIGELAGLNAGYAQSFWIELIAGIFRADESCSQIYTDPTAGNPVLKNLLDRVCQATGGNFLGKLQLPHKQANVYCFDRAAYRQFFKQ